MDINLSNRVNAIKPSPTLAVTNKAAELRAAGQDIIGLGAGEPDFDTPEHIKDAAIKAIKDGQTKYTAVDGTPALKNAIIEKFSNDNGFNYEPKQILVSCGGKQSFFNMSLALLNPGDEVVIPAPYWVSYPDMVKIAGGIPVIIDTTDKDNFKINADQLRAAITHKTRLLVLNSPSNPSGAAYTKEELSELAAVLMDFPNVLVATDDMYEHILWTPEPFVNILNVCPELYERCIVLNGVSKAYSMTGWRIGYAAGPATLIGAMKKIQSQSTSNPSSISQAASVAALQGSQDAVKVMLKAFKERHDYVHGRLNAMNGITCNASDGTFYAFPNMSELITQIDGVSNDLELAEHVIQKAKLALVPGSAFGCEGYARLSFATGMDVLEEALNRLESLS